MLCYIDILFRISPQESLHHYYNVASLKGLIFKTSLDCPVALS